MCRTLCPTFQVKTSDIRSKTSDMYGKNGFFIFTVLYILYIYVYIYIYIYISIYIGLCVCIII